MKKTMILAIAAIILISAKNDPANFNGKWLHDAATSTFEVEIVQNSSSAQIVGSYCSVQQSGNFIDCADGGPTDKNLKGSANDTIAKVTFKSGYCNCTGTATIKKIDETRIAWKIVQQPKGDFHVPLVDTLTKE